MRTLDLLKDIFNLHGKSVGWAIVEEVRHVSESVEYKPGLIIKGSRVYVDLFVRRFFSTIKLPELERTVYAARMERVGEGKVAIVAKEDGRKYVILPKTFINDILGTSIYGGWMEERLLL